MEVTEGARGTEKAAEPRRNRCINPRTSKTAFILFPESVPSRGPTPWPGFNRLFALGEGFYFRFDEYDKTAWGKGTRNFF